MTLERVLFFVSYWSVCLILITWLWFCAYRRFTPRAAAITDPEFLFYSARALALHSWWFLPMLYACWLRQNAIATVSEVDCPFRLE